MMMMMMPLPRTIGAQTLLVFSPHHLYLFVVRSVTCEDSSRLYVGAAGSVGFGLAELFSLVFSLICPYEQNPCEQWCVN